MAEAGHVSRVEYDGKEIFIVGTAHVSRRSVEEVRRVIDEVRPDTVCVELDQLRYDTLVNGEQWRNLDVFTVIRQKRVLFLLTSLALSSYQRKIGERLGVRPGAELLAAVEEAERTGAELVLADRDIQATLKRTWANLSFWNKVQLGSELLVAPFAVQQVDEERIEQLKDQDTISEVMQELANALPGVKEPLIDERDRFLMSKIQEAPGQRIVAVVGAGHVEGMLTHLGARVDRDELSQLPPPSRWARALKWVIPTIVLLAFSWGYYKHSGEGLRDMLLAWALPNSIIAALFSIVALAHPLTVLAAFIASPITSLNPTINTGMVAGLVEAWLRRPRVEDCEGVPEAVRSVGSMYRNRVTRVLLVAVLATLGSALGAWVGATWVVTYL
ncbi:MAG: TraB/GumN family protein [Myxococcales bacterium]|jgi:pheromone shutdown-related protein TraB|nr:TraB/GumN family protein [Myxococcales bacterium]